MTTTPVNLRILLQERVEQFADKTFLISEIDGRTWTYQEFDESVARAADVLRSRKIKKGDVVSLLMPNSPEYIIGYFACWKIGAIAGPINGLLKEHEISWVRENSSSRLLLSEAPVLAGGEYVDLREALASESGPVPRAGDTDITSDDTAVIIYTSGTTGKPKGCLLSHGNLIANARQITEWMGFGPEDRLLTVMPLFHMNAVSVTTLTALYAGGSTVISPKFSASRFWDIVDKYEVTSFGSVATMLSMLLERNRASELSNQGSDDPRPQVPSPGHAKLRFAMCGSAPIPVEVLKTFEETFGVLVIEGYGLSESTCRSTFNPPDTNRRPGSCGKPIGNEMMVVNETDKEVPDGVIGEIVLRGQNIFKGYYDNEEATTKAFANGWFHTGDLGYRDSDGFFYIADRKSDMIIRGGENIYPREIDDLLYTHHAVAAAAVIGVPDTIYGEEVVAFIVLKKDAKAGEGEIIQFCKDRLADFKCPKSVHFVEDIPKGPTGKLLKRELAKRLM